MSRSWLRPKGMVDKVCFSLHEAKEISVLLKLIKSSTDRLDDLFAKATVKEDTNGDNSSSDIHNP